MKFKQILYLFFSMALGYGLGQQGQNLWATPYPQSSAHEAASAAVHGLGSDVNVFGNRDTSAEFIQRATFNPATTDTTDIAIHQSALQTNTYAVAYSGTPFVWWAGTSDTSQVLVSVDSVGTTSFRSRIISPVSTNVNLSDGRYVVLGN